MKVLLLSPPLSTAGGIQRYTLTLVRALREVLGEGNVRCLTLSESSSAGGKGNLSLKSKLSFISHALWSAVSWRPDLIICSHLAIGPIGRFIANMRRRPYWVFVYGIEAWRELPGWKADSLRKADRVFVISAFSRDRVVERHQIDARRISNLPCSLDDALLRVDPAPKGVCDLIPDSSPVILTVARMASSERYKGHDEVLNSLPSVMAKVPNLTYAIVGGGDDLPRLKELAATLGLDKNVVFTGEISDTELVALYRRSDIFLLPARTVIDNHHPKGEGFGIVYLEAMAFEKPVIGPNTGAPVEVIEDGKTGLLVDPNDSESLTQALVQLLTHPEQAQEMGRAGRERGKQLFSYATFRERLRKMLVDPAAKGILSPSIDANLESDTSVLPL